MPLVIDVPADAVHCVLAPIDPEQPVGHFDSEDETYQAIDQEMVKLGGLREVTIDWPYIDEASRHYLARHCKHLRILSHLQVVWLRTRQWGRWADSLALLAGMVELYWDTAHPKPGPTGYLAKRACVQRLLEGLGQALPTLERSSFAPAYKAVAEQALVTLQRNAGQASLDLAQIETLHQQLAKYCEPVAGSSREFSTAPVSALNPSAFLSTQTPLPGNEREQRRALLLMAEQLTQQDPYDPVGYQLRRFGLWSHLQAAPCIIRDWRTELSAVPHDIVDGYQQALQANALEPGLLLRIEKSVAASPYWLRGSYLAAQVATRLAMEEVASAIRCSCERFVCRLPALLQLCFSDGTPFADAQTQAWITAADQREAASAAAPEYSGLRDELLTQLEREGVEVVLQRLQQLQVAHEAPRQRSHVTVIAADLLASRGLAWLADDLYASVARLMRDTRAQAWEPELYQKVARLGAGSAWPKDD